MSRDKKGGVVAKPRQTGATAASIISLAMNQTPPTADAGFSYSRPFFEQLVDHALAHAKKLGATDAGAEASEGCGLSVGVRKGELETVERNRDKSPPGQRQHL